LTGGIVVIVLEANETNQANAGLVITSIVLLNVGLFPLSISTLRHIELAYVFKIHIEFMSSTED
jgi:hypothetical protein